MKTVSVLMLLLVLACSATAQGFRKYSNEFLNIGIGARGLAMSGSMVACTDDVTSTFWNPAGLMQIHGTLQADVMHSEYFAGIAKFDYGAVSVPASDNKRRLGFSLIRLGIDDIPNTLYLVQPDGSLNYDNITSFSAADYAFLFSYAQQVFNDYYSLGGNVKVIHRTLGSFADSWGFGLDAGLQYRRDNLSLGVFVKDITTTFNAWSFNFSDADKQVLLSTGNIIPESSTELTAPAIILGGAYKFHFGNRVTLLPELDFNVTTDGQRNVLISAAPFSVDPHLGVECGFMKTVYLRAGLGNYQRATDNLTGAKIQTIQPNIGLGLHLRGVALDYALTNLGSLSQSLYSNVFSLRITLKETDPELTLKSLKVQ